MQPLREEIYRVDNTYVRGLGGKRRSSSHWSSRGGERFELDGVGGSTRVGMYCIVYCGGPISFAVWHAAATLYGVCCPSPR